MIYVNVFIGFCYGIIIGFISGILYIKTKQIDKKYSFDYPSDIPKDIPKGIAPPNTNRKPILKTPDFNKIRKVRDE